MIQLPDVLSIYNVDEHVGLARSSDRTDSYIEWGLQYLSTESPRVLGDYLCTSPVSAAVSARSLRGVRRSLRSALAARPARPLRVGVRGPECGEDRPALGGVGGPPMTVDQGRLAARGASSAALRPALPHPRHAGRRCCWASLTPRSSCAKPGRPFSGWFPSSRRSRCFSLR